MRVACGFSDVEMQEGISGSRCLASNEGSLEAKGRLLTWIAEDCCTAAIADAEVEEQPCVGAAWYSAVGQRVRGLWNKHAPIVDAAYEY